jgi:hypothetical protein
MDNRLAAATPTFVVWQIAACRLCEIVVLIKGDFIPAHGKAPRDMHLVNWLLIFAVFTLDITHAEFTRRDDDHLRTLTSALEPIAKYLSGLETSLPGPGLRRRL